MDKLDGKLLKNETAFALPFAEPWTASETGSWFLLSSVMSAMHLLHQFFSMALLSQSTAIKKVK